MLATKTKNKTKDSKPSKAKFVCMRLNEVELEAWYRRLKEDEVKQGEVSAWMKAQLGLKE